jgi:hypothetical protein
LFDDWIISHRRGQILTRVKTKISSEHSLHSTIFYQNTRACNFTSKRRRKNRNFWWSLIYC